MKRTPSHDVILIRIHNIDAKVACQDDTFLIGLSSSFGVQSSYDYYHFLRHIDAWKAIVENGWSLSYITVDADTIPTSIPKEIYDRQPPIMFSIPVLQNCSPHEAYWISLRGAHQLLYRLSRHGLPPGGTTVYAFLHDHAWRV